MKLREEILREHSKKQTEKIAAWVCLDKKRFTTLLHLFFHDEYRVVQRTAWVVKLVADQHPEWTNPYIRKMLLYCKQPVHDAVKRNVVNILQDIDLPENLQGLAATTCFDFLGTPNLPVAIKVFSMTVLYNITKQHPELRNELKTLIEEQMEYESAAFRSRGSKVLKQLAKQQLL
ncbi:MAG: hypothetical protein ABIO46_12130 [Chitinophagales bacterium]